MYRDSRKRDQHRSMEETEVGKTFKGNVTKQEKIEGLGSI